MNKPVTPLIGLTVYSSSDVFQYYPNDYVNAVRLFGGIPILLPPGDVNVSRLVAQLDGVILTGGGDINPDNYNQTCHSKLYWVNEEQDNYEFQIAKHALDLYKPILATCRGMQIINTLLGGSLHQHLPDQYGESVLHRSSKNQSVDHDINVDDHSNLAKMLGCARFSVKSWHHQSINVLAPGFRAVGFADDGVIEAIESDAYPDLIAVQWHPEIDNENNALQQKLFQGWLKKCS